MTIGPLTASAPTAPRSPAATPGNATVTLTWLAPSSNGGATIDKYIVQRSTTGNSGWTTVGSPTGTSFTSSGLTNGVRYYFRIRAHNLAGWGTFSTVVSAVPRTVPSAPLTPTATPGNGTVTLAWLAPSSTGGATIDKYAVQRSTSLDLPWTTIAYPTTRSYTNSGLSNGVRYYYRILAHNAAGWGPASNVTSAKPRTVPGAPQNVVATGQDGYSYVSWGAPASNGGAAVDHYAIQQATSSGGPWTTIGSPTTPGWITGTLTNGHTYYFRVRAHNAAGWGPWSAIDDATPISVPSAPLALWGLSDYKVHLFWDPPASNGGAVIDYYRVEYSYDATHWYFWGTTTDTAYTTSWHPIGLHYFRVTAHNAAGNGPYSNTAYITTPEDG